jgi:hypothetical protein
MPDAGQPVPRSLPGATLTKLLQGLFAGFLPELLDHSLWVRRGGNSPSCGQDGVGVAEADEDRFTAEATDEIADIAELPSRALSLFAPDLCEPLQFAPRKRSRLRRWRAAPSDEWMGGGGFPAVWHGRGVRPQLSVVLLLLGESWPVSVVALVLRLLASVELQPQSWLPL